MDIECNEHPNTLINWKYVVEADDVSIGLVSDSDRQIDRCCFYPTQSVRNRYFYSLRNAGILECRQEDGVSRFNNEEICLETFNKVDEIELKFNISNQIVTFNQNGNTTL